MAKTNERKPAETRANKNLTKETPKIAPIQLEFFEGDTLAVCDVETGICTVPGSTDLPASDNEAADRNESTGK